MTSKIFVTGATGFLGSHLVEQLQSQGHHTVALVRPRGPERIPQRRQRPAPSGRQDRVAWLRSLGVEIRWGDLAGPTLPKLGGTEHSTPGQPHGETLAAALDGCRVVYHVAGLVKSVTHKELWQVNQHGTVRLLEACARMSEPPVVVLVSSLAAAGPARGGRLVRESDPPEPISDYGKSKLAAEQAATAFAHKVPISIVRPPMIFGPREQGLLALFRSVRKSGCLVMPAVTGQQLALVAVKDVVAALQLVACRGQRLSPQTEGGTRGEGIYYVAASESPTVPRLAELLAQATGRRRILVIHLPCWLARCAGTLNELWGRCWNQPVFYGADKSKEATAGSWICCDRKIREELGFHGSGLLSDQLRQTALWYHRNGWLRSDIGDPRTIQDD